MEKQASKPCGSGCSNALSKSDQKGHVSESSKVRETQHHLARFLPITISLTDLGNWQPSITIVPRGDGTFTYAPTSAVVTGDSSTTHDVVYHSNIWG